jgi:hypothetical protein
MRKRARSGPRWAIRHRVRPIGRGAMGHRQAALSDHRSDMFRFAWRVPGLVHRSVLSSRASRAYGGDGRSSVLLGHSMGTAMLHRNMKSGEDGAAVRGAWPSRNRQRSGSAPAETQRRPRGDPEETQNGGGPTATARLVSPRSAAAAPLVREARINRIMRASPASSSLGQPHAPSGGGEAVSPVARPPAATDGALPSRSAWPLLATPRTGGRRRVRRSTDADRRAASSLCGFGFALAKGPRENLGLFNAAGTSRAAEVGPGVFRKGVCPTR